MTLFMKTHRCRIGNEWEPKGEFGFVGAAAGMNTGSATAAGAKQPSLGQADWGLWGESSVLQAP